MSEADPVRRSTVAIVVCVIASAVLLAADLGSKAWAAERLSAARLGDAPAVCQPDPTGYVSYQRIRRPGMPVLEGWLELEYAENCGAAFGLFRSPPYWVRIGVFGTAAVLATSVLLWLFAKGRGGVWFAWSVPFVVAGALGNLVDRARAGYVVDFIHFQWQGWFDYPTFNVADIWISAGVVMLLIDGFRRGPDDEPAKREIASSEAPAEASDGAAPEPTEAGEARPYPEASESAEPSSEQHREVSA